jgi:hypothetical protein
LGPEKQRAGEAGREGKGALSMTDFPLEPVYVGNTAPGQFCAFSRKGDTVQVYLPDDLYQHQMQIDLNKWLEMAATYSEPNDLHLYDDVINAVWQELSFNNVLIKKNVKVLNTAAGKFYPRIWRGIYAPERAYCYNPISPRSMYKSVYIRSTVAATSIYESLQDLFKYVEPATVNMDVFGNRIRELLILACTEVEASWRAILEENSTERKDRYTTKDYIKVKEPLQLSSWGVELRDYPGLGTFSPFANWQATDPTKSLPWYDGYNAVKHHREAESAQASLKNLINAVAAVHILQGAQWGPEIYDRFFGNLPSPFATTHIPTFELSDLYVPSLDGQLTLTSMPFFNRLL